ncbi:hypothetical protein BMS3Abin04_01845 [bacterium BMS3Abin04]|nr:hypothetical protein BMS3Abin04_01845 [bacterium BMS3Abin04]
MNLKTIYFILFLGLFTFVFGQVKTPLPPQPNDDNSAVLLNIDAVAQIPNNNFELPTGIIKKLSKLNNLSRFSIQDEDIRRRLNVRIHFTNMHSFLNWYESKEAQTLLREIKQTFKNNFKLNFIYTKM